MFFTVYLGCGAQPQQQNSDVDTGTGKQKVGDLRGLFCLCSLLGADTGMEDRSCSAEDSWHCCTVHGILEMTEE